MNYALVRSLLWSSLTVLGLGAAGCKCKDHPYVPYTIGSGTTASAPDAAAPPPPSASHAPLAVDGGSFPRVIGQQAPPGTSTWTLGGMSVSAPPGRVFLVGLALSAPGQPAQAAAFVGDGGSMAGEVVTYRADAGGRVVGPTTLARLPDWLPAGQDCVHMPQLSQIGPSTLWLDVPAVCKRAEPKKPNRYLAALSTSQAPAVRAELRVAELAPGERLAMDADGADRDGDGADDLLVQLALEGLPQPLTAPGTRASAQLKFLGRAAGMSRDTQEPGTSLRQLAAWQTAQAARKDGAEHALATARQARRLHTILCAEGGQPLVTLGDGATIPCGEVGALDDARFAEARALLTLGNAPAGFAVGGRLREARGKSKRPADLDAALDQIATARKVKATPVKVLPRGSSVALPMAFEPSGALLVQAEDGQLVRVDPQSGQETPAGDGPKWNPLAELVGDLRVQDAADPCKTDFLRVRIKGESSGNRELPVPILGGSPPSCSDAPLTLSLLDRNADGLVALVQGEPVFVSSEGERAQPVGWPSGPGAGGTARSPDGRWAAVAGLDKVLLRGPDKPEVWRPTVRFTLTSCTVANDARAVACLLERGIVVLTP